MPYPPKEYESLYTEAVFPSVSPWPGQTKCCVEGREAERGDRRVTVSCVHRRRLMSSDVQECLV